MEITNKVEFTVNTKIAPKKGNLVYEYNPFRNYRLCENKYEYNGVLYSEDTASEDVKNNGIYWKKGELVDFITDELQFDINHPVSIIPQYSYDGSVNLVLNDGVSPPKLINSRFSVTGLNTYEVIDRKGDNDSNIYDEGESFYIDTSLYKVIKTIPKIKFNGCISGGNLKVGNYFFYFKLADADGNETDFVGESGLVSIFIGHGSPKSVTTGQKNENSGKCVKFKLTDIDSGFDHVTVYYSRTTAEGSENAIPEYKKINSRFSINTYGSCQIIITGYEDTVDVSSADINLHYNIVDAAKAQAVCQNMLFLGNVHKPDIPYDKLTELSLHFCPYAKYKSYDVEIDSQYNITSKEKGYYDEQYIYNYTGYWPGELYRFGVVYILATGELSPVFNIRGIIDVGEYDSDQYTEIPLTDTINYNADTYYLSGGKPYENVKGVVSFKPNSAVSNSPTVYGVAIHPDEGLIDQLKQYVRGYFFVRQNRIPTIVAQGITVGVDQQAHTPTIPTQGSLLTSLEDLEHTYVTTSDINGVNYISEGFLSRYAFSIEKKKTTLFKKIGTALVAVTAVAALAIATVYTGGAALAVAGAAFAATTVPVTTAAVTAAVTSSIVASTATVATIATVAGGAALVTSAALAVGGTVQQIHYNANHVVKSLDGRHTKVGSGYKLEETSASRKLSQIFSDRIIIKDKSVNKIQAIICPDFEVNPPYYNQIFTGNEHLISEDSYQPTDHYFVNNYRHFYLSACKSGNSEHSETLKVVAVGDDVPVVGIDSYKFRARAGNAEEAWRYESIGEEFGSDDSKALNNRKINSDIVRGSYGAYLGLADSDDKFEPATIVNIHVPKYSKTQLSTYIDIRMHDDSIYHPISERYDINDTDIFGNVQNLELYRGDCYICQFTHRVNRNFNAPSAPYNDEIVDANTWKDNYNPSKTSSYESINVGDVDAVQLGMWITFPVRSSNNLNIRTLDGSNVDETAMTGHRRGYYPYLPMSVGGTYKHPDSQVFNNGFTYKNNERQYFNVPDVPHIKNWFGTRIMYSDIHINDAYKNGFRTFRGQNYQDYTREYGEIIKLISVKSGLLCVFEHGICYLAVNERTVAGQGNGGSVYINTAKVLPLNPVVISDSIGSQWPDSVIVGDSYVYGVDTVAKKIWRTDGGTLKCISDYRVQEFLNTNITLTEKEMTPIIGIRNVKTFYNAYKHDVMFTFYDNLSGTEEKVWNLCWNEDMLGEQGAFTTFYSWVPSVMENIDNIPFSFNRDTSKYIAKLGKTQSISSFAEGVTLTNVLINNTLEKETGNATVSKLVDDLSFDVEYATKLGTYKTVTIDLENLIKYNSDSTVDLTSVPQLDLSSEDGPYPILGNFIYNQNKWSVENTEEVIYVDADKKLTQVYGDLWKTNRDAVVTGLIGVLGLKNDVLKESKQNYTISYSLERDIQNNYKLFEIKILGYYKYPEDALYAGTIVPIYGLYYKLEASSVYTSKLKQNSETQVYTKNSDQLQAIHLLAEDHPSQLMTELYYRNISKTSSADYDTNKRAVNPVDSLINGYPIFKNINGKREYLPEKNQINADRIVTQLNIKATIELGSTNIGTCESAIAVAPKWNLQFLSTDFWKHGQAGIFDQADDIYPTYWYGKQHPFEFECIVVNNPAFHKVFTNLELIANKAKPESFHYEVIGEAYDFAKDKVNMYFRQEATKALWQYNGADITYDRNFLKVQPKQVNKSTDILRTYYSRTKSLNEVESYYQSISNPNGKNYDHLSGGEILYYPNRQEFRVCNHVKAVDVDDVQAMGSRGLIAANMEYKEDRWRVQINPLLIVQRNEYVRGLEGSTWAYSSSGTRLPSIPLYNSPIPDQVLVKGYLDFPKPGTTAAEENALCGLYDLTDYDSGISDLPLDTVNWQNLHERIEVPIRDTFLKVKIRYSGEDLAVIDWLNTIYQVSFI